MPNPLRTIDFLAASAPNSGNDNAQLIGAETGTGRQRSGVAKASTTRGNQHSGVEALALRPAIVGGAGRRALFLHGSVYQTLQHCCRAGDCSTWAGCPCVLGARLHIRATAMVRDGLRAGSPVGLVNPIRLLTCGFALRPVRLLNRVLAMRPARIR